jgi:hypothetical protein
MGLLPPSKQLADDCDRELLLEIAISPSFDPTLSYVRSHLVPPTTHAERTEARRKDGEDDFGGREGHGVSGRHRLYKNGRHRVLNVNTSSGTPHFYRPAIDRNAVRCELMAFTRFFDPRWQESVVTENIRLPFFTVRRIGHGRRVAGTNSFLRAACADALPPTLWRHSR